TSTSPNTNNTDPSSPTTDPNSSSSPVLVTAADPQPANPTPAPVTSTSTSTSPNTNNINPSPPVTDPNSSSSPVLVTAEGSQPTSNPAPYQGSIAEGSPTTTQAQSNILDAALQVKA